MKIVIAPQGFKGSITGLEAAQAIQRGVNAAVPEAQTVLVPVADGGDGTLHALVDATGGQIFSSRVQGPLGLYLEASWGVMGDEKTAVIEMARPSGLALLPPERRDPRITTTWGTGNGDWPRPARNTGRPAFCSSVLRSLIPRVADCNIPRTLRFS